MDILREFRSVRYEAARHQGGRAVEFRIAESVAPGFHRLRRLLPLDPGLPGSFAHRGRRTPGHLGWPAELRRRSLGRRRAGATSHGPGGHRG